MEWLGMMFGGAGRGLVEAALLIGLFWAALAHPDRIRSVAEFRLATLLLGASLVVPVMVQLLLAGNAMGAPRPARAGQDVGLAAYAMAIPPVLSMLAVILGLDSVTPRPGSEEMP